MITGIIYKYTSPSNKIYVGKTINESERKHAFLTKERYAGIKIDNARAKYGPKNFKYDVIERHEYSSVEEATESLNILEAYYIGLYNSLVKGYKMMIVRVIQNCGIISRKTNYKGQVILPFIFFLLILSVNNLLILLI